MSILDIALMGLIACGAFYLLYRSIWKKKGDCCGCAGCASQKKGHPEKDPDAGHCGT
jgi:hypothetical protein